MSEAEGFLSAKGNHVKSHIICNYLLAERHTVSLFGEIAYKCISSSAFNHLSEE